MNTVNRVELALLRAASQMGYRDAALFRLVAEELRGIMHDDVGDADKMQAVLDDYRNHS